MAGVIIGQSAPSHATISIDGPDLYSPMLSHMPLVEEQMSKIQNRISRELRFQTDLMKLRGALDMTLAQVRGVVSD